MTLCGVRVMVFLSGLSVVCAGKERKVENNVSKEDRDPDGFWPITGVLNNNTNKHIDKNSYAVYENVNFSPDGPVIGTGALTFQGSSNPSMTIFNSGIFDGSLAATWIFYARSYFSQNAVLLQYSGDSDSAGIQIRLNSDDTLSLVVEKCNPTCTSDTFKTQKVKVAPGNWMIIGITWNKLWPSPQFDFMEISPDGGRGAVEKLDQFDISSLLDNNDFKLTGDITIGASVHSEYHLSGDISCLQFYNVSLQGGTLGATPTLCDPSSWGSIDYGDPIGSQQFYNKMAALFTTVDVTTVTSKITEDVTFPTSEVSQTATTVDKTTTFVASSNSLYAVTSKITEDVTFPTSEVSQTATTVDKTTTFVASSNSLYEVVGNCFVMTRIGKNKRLESPFQIIHNYPVKQCVRLCMSSINCIAITVDTVLSVCTLANTTTMVPDSNASVYIRK